MQKKDDDAPSEKQGQDLAFLVGILPNGILLLYGRIEFGPFFSERTGKWHTMLRSKPE